jgi:hypothetical protein
MRTHLFPVGGLAAPQWAAIALETIRHLIDHGRQAHIRAISDAPADLRITGVLRASPGVL